MNLTPVCARELLFTPLYNCVIICFQCTLQFRFWFCDCCCFNFSFNPLNAKLNPICHFLALLGAHPILHVSRIRVNIQPISFSLWAIPLTFQIAYLIIFCFFHFRQTVFLPHFVVKIAVLLALH